MSSKLSRVFRKNVSPDTNAVTSHELAVIPDRLVVFGTRALNDSLQHGAQNLARYVRAYLEENGIDAEATWTSDASHIADTFFGRSRANPDAKPTIPKGVIAFPEMRQYTPHGGMTIETPMDDIQRLCDEHEVPLVRIETMDPQAITEGLGALAAAQSAHRQIER